MMRLAPEKAPRFPGRRTVLAVETLPPGTEFFDAETGAQKRALEATISDRDRRCNETCENRRKNGLFAIDGGFPQFGRTGLVETIWTKLATPHSEIEPVFEIQSQN